MVIIVPGLWRFSGLSRISSLKRLPLNEFISINAHPIGSRRKNGHVFKFAPDKKAGLLYESVDARWIK